MANFRPRPLISGKSSVPTPLDAKWSPDVSERKKKPMEPTRIRTPNLVARSQRTVPTRLSAETLTGSLNESRDNCNSARNISQSCKNTADRYGRNLVSLTPTTGMKFHGFERRNMQRVVDSVSCVHMRQASGRSMNHVHSISLHVSRGHQTVCSSPEMSQSI